MTTDIKVNKPEPIVSKNQRALFNSETDVKLAIKGLEAGKPIVITAFYSNGMLLLKALKIHLDRKLPNKSFQEQREYRTEYRKLSNLILLEIVAHKLEVKKAPFIGCLEILYPETSNFFLEDFKLQFLYPRPSLLLHSLRTPDSCQENTFLFVECQTR